MARREHAQGGTLPKLAAMRAASDELFLADLNLTTPMEDLQYADYEEQPT